MIMMKNTQFDTSLRRKLAAITLTGAAAAMLIVAPYAFSFAADSSVPDSTTSASQQMRKMPPPQGNLKNRIQQYVNDGKITNEQADKLQAALKDQHNTEQKNHEKFMKNLPGKTGISENTLKDILTFQGGPRHHQGQRGQQMQQLVQNGKITQAEATSLQTYFKNHHPKGPAQGQEKMSGEQQRKSPDEMCQDVANGTGISQSRVKEIMELMRPQGQPPKDGQCQPQQDAQ
jgi:polyhydroxyalkanoate synthesis regulator phasin